ncbi:VWA domain-containing protein [Pimelobacter simplex]|uniref:Mg-protoporphyrin IX chelatase n=1 Tax=Nocardioides simplex TaxID=2045 RepID=A0A0A1DRQ9_NOCSI|nr:VWA domain-containing protein [Pimelobacter simplex]AIY18055.1 ChlI component of cobalt chelatase involved in B12 biosynthesis [Pimelobacter simplex]MCG8153645.1 VWA domain-containing protein [Pimelobacter simplex]GEB17119.1 magnesium chelatase [Pimelobacter simplex]SFN08219.1 magnesium chelatase subunit D [Pimelobacter simplex]
MSQQFPFSAVVGADGPDGPDPMALALILTTIAPDVGGVLVRGEKGTAKSTIVRALAAVLPPIDVVAGDRFSSDPRDAGLSPDGPFGPDVAVETRPVRLVELPVGATEDRVLGSLHLERALAEGKAEYEPGLLARAHRGILYVDEVNLLHDHLVDLLLDAAAMGRATVERDGVSVEHAARFVLVGTMNPEEGELRPQLLDRFGLTVEVAAPREPALRAEVVRRRMAYDADPAAFAASYAEAEAALRARIADAQALVGSVRLTDAGLLKIAEVCAAFDVDGLRADIVTARTAVAHAAWSGRAQVTLDDIRVAARLALPHRRRRKPFDAPGLDEELLEQALGDEDDLPPEPEPEPDGPEPDGPAPEDGGPGADGDAGDPETEVPPPPVPPSSTDSTDSINSADGAGSAPAPSSVAPTGATYRTRLLTVHGVGTGTAGRRSRARTTNGRRIGATTPRPGQGGAIHLVETIRASAGHQRVRGRAGSGPLVLRPADLRVAVREGRESNLVLFCVDASGSMAARRRMEQVKTAVLSLLLDAYQRRDKVGLVTFRGAEAAVALPPTHSVDAAAQRLEELPSGGRTPLAEGLLEAAHLLSVERTRDPQRRPLLVVVTDGRATSGADAVARSRMAAGLLAESGVTCVVVDCESGPMRMGLAATLAEHLGAEHVPIGEVSAEALVDAARRAA